MYKYPNPKNLNREDHPTELNWSNKNKSYMGYGITEFHPLSNTRIQDTKYLAVLANQTWRKQAYYCFLNYIQSLSDQTFVFSTTSINPT